MCYLCSVQISLKQLIEPRGIEINFYKKKTKFERRSFLNRTKPPSWWLFICKMKAFVIIITIMTVLSAICGFIAFLRIVRTIRSCEDKFKRLKCKQHAEEMRKIHEDVLVIKKLLTNNK